MVTARLWERDAQAYPEAQACRHGQPRAEAQRMKHPQNKIESDKEGKGAGEAAPLDPSVLVL